LADFTQLKQAVLKGDAEGARNATRKALAEGAGPLDLVDSGISPAMEAVGKLFEAGEYFVPELLMSASAAQEVFGIIRPLLASQGTKPAGRVVLGTVQGDFHDIGKNLVGAMLEGGGFEVIDLGVNVAPDRFVAAVREEQAQVVGFSALLTTTLPAMKQALEAFDRAGVRDKVKVMIGGAPTTQAYADSIGADGYGRNAAQAVDLAKRLVGPG
jgi:5-methyltetrahydrofolate--homocysteine methyltransferase